MKNFPLPKLISISIALCIVLVLFCSCKGNFHTAKISLYDIKLSEVKAHSGAAYYLSNDGVLYCTGADSDAASFVAYQESKSGIVAKNVKSFGELVGGGYYINYNNDLYMWNESELDFYGYDRKKEHVKILENVHYTTTSSNCLIYIDTKSNLYLIGKFLNETYSVDNPKLLSKDVVCADVNNNTVIWAKKDGNIGFFGEIDTVMLTELKENFTGFGTTDIRLSNNFVTILTNNQLWFYGDYQKLISGKASKTTGLTRLGDNIESVSCSLRTIAALDGEGKVLLWGRAVSNDMQNTKTPQFDYFENFCLTKNAVDVFVSDSSVCYVDKNGRSNIFYASGWPAFYGNSTKDTCVGVKRNPNTWID